jgi:hypothetical protein
VLREAVPVGRRIEMSLEGPGGQVLKATATVAWCLDAGDGTHLAGVSLDKEAGHSLLAALARCGRPATCRPCRPSAHLGSSMPEDRSLLIPGCGRLPAGPIRRSA